MNSDNDTDRTSKSGGNTLVTPATALLKRMIETSLAPRMLTRYEIDLLRQSKKEIAQVLDEVLASKSNASQAEV